MLERKETIGPGIYEGMPFDEYVAIPAWNASAIKRLSLSPRAAKYGLAVPESQAMKAGTLVHMAVLEPERFEAEVIVPPKFHPTWKDETALAKGYEGGRESMERWGELHGIKYVGGGKYESEGSVQVMESSLRDEVLGIAAAFRACEPARKLVESSKTEVVIVWDDPVGVRCKIRIDCLAMTETGTLIGDVKKTTSVRPEAMQRQIGAFGMHIQAALYLRGVCQHFGREYDPLDFGQPDTFLWIAFESRPPHFCRVFPFGTASREEATNELERMLRVIRWCEKEGQWPDYSERLYALETPDYLEPYRYPDGFIEE